jgi:hypothetical protein
VVELRLKAQAAENNLPREAGIPRAERRSRKASGIGGVAPARDRFQYLESGFAGG